MKFYRSCKLEFPNWVGIVPESWLEYKVLLFKVYLLLKKKMNWDYKSNKFFNFASSVGIVPESWLEWMNLFIKRNCLFDCNEKKKKKERIIFTNIVK